MRAYFIALTLLVSTPVSYAADFITSRDQPFVFLVDGCRAGEASYPTLQRSLVGAHTLISKCLPIVCVYTSETPIPLLGRNWKISLMVQVKPGRDIREDPQFDREQVLEVASGIRTKTERDALLQSLLREQKCRSTYHANGYPNW